MHFAYRVRISIQKMRDAKNALNNSEESIIIKNILLIHTYLLGIRYGGFVR